jgi:long-chain acyl-CoA synthetase
VQVIFFVDTVGAATAPTLPPQTFFAPMSEGVPPGLDLSVGYATIVSGTSGEGPVLRNKVAADTLTDRPVKATDLENIYDLFSKSALKLRPNAPCFGSRIRDDGSVGPYSWQTYSEVDARIDAFAAGLWKLDLVPLTPDGYRFLGLYCKNSRDWMVAAEACFKTGVVIVPMYDTLGPETVQYIQGQTGCQSVICTAAELKNLLPPRSCPFKDVIVIGPLDESTKARCTAAGMRVHRFAELESFGAPDNAVLVKIAPPKYDDIALFCYTSGTTGDPKGAMISHGNVLSALAMADHPAFTVFRFDPSTPQEVHLSYLPVMQQ